jgi:hypothetical protein
MEKKEELSLCICDTCLAESTVAPDTTCAVCEVGHMLPCDIGEY